MAVTYTTAAKNARLQAVADLIDAGTAGKLKIGTAGMATVLATFTLADPCGSVAAGVLTFDFDPDISDVSADNTGTAAAAIITDSADTTVVSGLTVGTAATDIILNNTSIATGQQVDLTTGTITHA